MDMIIKEEALHQKYELELLCNFLENISLYISQMLALTQVILSLSHFRTLSFIQMLSRTFS